MTKKVKKTRFGALEWMIGAFLIIILAVAVLFMILPDEDATVTETVPEQPAELTPMQELERRLQSPAADLPGPEDIVEGLPGNLSMLVYLEDITGDGRMESVVIEPHPGLDPGPSADYGYDHVIQSMKVFRHRNGMTETLLSIDRQSMRNHDGDKLIDQVEAVGYGLRLQPFDEPPYEQEVILFEIVILDEEGRPASDDLTIFWRFGDDTYDATNAFGAP